MKKDMNNIIMDIGEGNIYNLRRIKNGWDINKKMSFDRNKYLRPIEIAILTNSFKSIKTLVEAGAELNTPYEECFKLAVDHANMETIIYLLKNGAIIPDGFMQNKIKNKILNKNDLCNFKNKELSSITDDYNSNFNVIDNESSNYNSSYKEQLFKDILDVYNFIDQISLQVAINACLLSNTIHLVTFGMSDVTSLDIQYKFRLVGKIVYHNSSMFLNKDNIEMFNDGEVLILVAEYDDLKYYTVLLNQLYKRGLRIILISMNKIKVYMPYIHVFLHNINDDINKEFTYIEKRNIYTIITDLIYLGILDGRELVTNDGIV